MTREAIEYFKFRRKIFCEDYLKICPKDSIAYQATLKEKEFYDMAIKALEQEPTTKIDESNFSQEQYKADLQNAYDCGVASVKRTLKQEPKAKTFDILHFVADNAGLSTFEAIEKAYNMGVSEQGLVLDKIRAEIEAIIGERNLDDYDFCSGLICARKIIDKYKAESEK